MDFGSIKNVGKGVIENIVKERKENGSYKNFEDFCERMKEETVNKKCIESLIKVGAFDDFEETRRTLLESFEMILDAINETSKRNLKGQVNMFDIQKDNKNFKIIKHQMPKKSEFEEKEILSMEKEMMGIYISGHPLNNLRELIKKETTINSLNLNKISEEYDISQDGKKIKYAGIITSIKKKFTKRNTQMAFIKVEDLYGSCEVIIFDSYYEKTKEYIKLDNIILIEGKLSIREDEEIKIVANNILELKSKENLNIPNVIKKEINKKVLQLNITNLSEDKKIKLRTLIKACINNKNNIDLEVIDDKKIKSCGRRYVTNESLKKYEEILGKDRIKLI